MTKSKNLGLNLPSRDNTTDLADINVISGNFETIDNEFENVYNRLNNSGVVNIVSGNPIVLKDSAKAPLQQLKLYGKTTQNGTPTPSAPIDLVSVGDSGSFSVDVYGKNFVEITTDTKTSAGVTFTRNADNSFSLSGTGNANNVYNIGGAYLIQGTSYKLTGCASGGASNTYLIRVIGSNNATVAQDLGTGKTFTPTTTGFYTVGIRIQSGTVTDGLKFYPMIRLATETDETYEPCNKQTLTMPYTLRSKGDIKDEIDFAKEIITRRLGHIESYNGETITTGYTSNTGELSIGAEVVYVLPSPIEKTLTEQELNAYRQLYTNKGTTTILSEADMEVSYVADTKLYIDNKLAELTALTLEG